jgi:GNAT superfamily N-acetyltransferase
MSCQRLALQASLWPLRTTSALNSALARPGSPRRPECVVTQWSAELWLHLPRCGQPHRGNPISVGSYPFVLCLATPGDLHQVRGLVREAAEWLRTTKDTDQWARPWPSQAGQGKRMLNDLLEGKTWLLWDGARSVATITVDPEEPLDGRRQPVWPARKHGGRAVYVRRVVVRRSYAGQGLGAALLDWAADLAKREHKARLIRIDVWTTNVQLHAYYEKQGFTRRDAMKERASAPGGCWKLAKHPSPPGKGGPR